MRREENERDKTEKCQREQNKEHNKIGVVIHHRFGLCRSKSQRNDHRHLLCLWTNIASSFLVASDTSTQ